MILFAILILLWLEFVAVKNRPNRFVLTAQGQAIKERWGYLTVTASAKYSIPEEVILAVIGVESAGNANALNVNPNGSIDYGLMQVNNKGALADYRTRVKEVLNPLFPAENIDVGAWYLREVHQNFLLETWSEKIDAYNMGIFAHSQDRRNFDYVNRIGNFVQFV